MNTPVYELNADGSISVAKMGMEDTSETFRAAYKAMLDAGYKNTNKANWLENLNVGKQFDRFSPDVTMVNDGSVAGIGPKNTVAFLNSMGQNSTVYLHMAVPSSTPQDKLDQLAEMGGLMYQPRKADGSAMDVMTGFVPLDLNGSDPELAFENAMAKISGMDLNTVPIPVEDRDAAMMPIFYSDDLEPHDFSLGEKVNKLHQCLGDSLSVLNVPEQEIERVLGITYNEEPERDNSMQLRPSMAR